MPNNSLSKDLRAEEWIKRATDDEMVMRSILKHRDAPATPVCFHAQQMAEKYLKAFLVHYQKWYPKVHPLDTLWELCGELDSTFEEVKEDSVFLTSFYSPTRYPGDYPEFTWEECERAFAAALRIKEFVLSKVKPPATSGGFGLAGFIVVIAAVLVLAGGGYFAYQRFVEKKTALAPVNSFEDCVKAGYPVAGGVIPRFCVTPDGRRFVEKTDESDRVCTDEAKLCSDGSSVGRVPPSCEFAKCPGENGAAIDTSTWKTYRNEKYGFEVRYPADKFSERVAVQSVPPLYRGNFVGVSLVRFGRTYYQNENLTIDFVAINKSSSEIADSVTGAFGDRVTRLRIANRDAISIAMGDEGSGIYYYFLPLDTIHSLMVVRRGIYLPVRPTLPDLQEQEELFQQIISTLRFQGGP